jgi:hypothetical protein
MLRLVQVNTAISRKAYHRHQRLLLPLLLLLDRPQTTACLLPFGWWWWRLGLLLLLLLLVIRQTKTEPVMSDPHIAAMTSSHRLHNPADAAHQRHPDHPLLLHISTNSTRDSHRTAAGCMFLILHDPKPHLLLGQEPLRVGSLGRTGLALPGLQLRTQT